MKRIELGGLQYLIDEKNEDVYIYNNIVGGFQKVRDLTQKDYNQFMGIIGRKQWESTKEEEEQYKPTDYTFQVMDKPSLVNMYNSLIKKENDKLFKVKDNIRVFLASIREIIDNNDVVDSKFILRMIKGFINEIDRLEYTDMELFNRDLIHNMEKQRKLEQPWESIDDECYDCCHCYDRFMEDDIEQQDDNQKLQINWKVDDKDDTNDQIDVLGITVDLFLEMQQMKERMDNIERYMVNPYPPYIPIIDFPNTPLRPTCREGKWEVHWQTNTNDEKEDERR